MKRLFSLFLTLVIAIGVFTSIPITASARASGTYTDSIVWLLDDEGVLTISGSGDLKVIGSNSPYIYAPDVKEIIINEGITSIASGTFDKYHYITSVTLPDSVTTIGDNAFRGCFRLDSVTIPKGVTSISCNSFVDCSGLISIDVDSDNIEYSSYDGVLFNKEKTEIIKYPEGKLDESFIIPDSVMSLGEWSFCRTENLKSVVLHENVTNVGTHAFSGSNMLETVQLSSGLTNISDFAFYSCMKLKNIQIPDSVKTIGKNAFDACGLSSVVIPDSVEDIGKEAFRVCRNLKSVVLSKNISKIRNAVFSGCTSLTAIEIPDSVTSIGDMAFSNCSFTSLTIGGNVKSVGESAFNGCNELETVSILNGVESIGEYCFGNCPRLSSITIPNSVNTIGKGSFLHCRALTQMVIPGNVTCISESLFEGCWGLGSVLLPNSVTEIERKAFSECSSLYDIEIPDSVIEIGKSAFYKCKKLSSVVIPDTVTKIEEYAFSNCEGLISVVIAGSVECIYSTSFINCKNLTSISVEECNPFYYSIDGVLFDKENSLVQYPIGRTDTSYTIPSGTTCIEPYAFMACENITTVIIPDSVTNIGSYAFSECDRLTSIAIGEGVTSIGYCAFRDCDSLSSITISNSVVEIGGSAFMGCEHLSEVHITDVAAWCNIDFENEYSNPLWEAYSLYLDDKLAKNIVIPDGVTHIPARAFSCTTLVSITIPVSVKTIGDFAFRDCSGLKYVFYKGTQEEWSAIPRGTIDSYLTGARMHYSATDHTISSWIIDRDATVEAAGKKHKECTVCRAVLKTEEIPQLKPTTPKLSSASRTASGVKVVWSAVEGADKYIVYRKTSKSGWTNLGTTTGTSFTDTKAKTGTTYYYTVKAQNEAGASGYNKTGLKIKYVAAPKLTKIANESSGVRVYWSKVSGADGYYLYRRVAGSKTWTKVATIKKGSTTSYLDKKASGGKTYEYIIKCYDGSTPSASAAKVIKIKRLTVPKLVSASSSKTGITVKWGKVAGAEGYLVYRKTGKGSWVQLTKVEGNAKVSFVDKSAKKGTTYTYTVRAYSGSYTSAYNTKGLSVKDKY